MDGSAATGPVPLELRADLADLYAGYADVLDGDELEAWPDFFTEACRYEVIPRENRELGLPLATVRCESRGMLMDRVFAVRQTQMFAPRYLRHLIGPPRILAMNGGEIETRANYAVFETQPDDMTRVLNVGRYLDIVVRDGGRLRFRQKLCVFDSLLVPTSLVYPI